MAHDKTRKVADLREKYTDEEWKMIMDHLNNRPRRTVRFVGDRITLG